MPPVNFLVIKTSLYPFTNNFTETKNLQIRFFYNLCKLNLYLFSLNVVKIKNNKNTEIK
jgi:hypothetical protein